MRLVAFALLMALILVTQSAVTYAAVYASCAKPAPRQADKHCCPTHEKAAMPADPCQKMCDLGDEDVPAVTRSSDVKVGKNTISPVAVKAVETAPSSDEVKLVARSADRFLSGSKAYLLNTCFLI